MGFAPLGLFAGSVAILAVWAWLSAAELRRRTTSLQPSVAAAAVAREQQSELGRLFADPSVAATLQLLRQKLPADLRVVSALGAGEHLTITLEAADPDALRRLLRAEPWFAGFRERGQAMGRDGSIRVTFERSE